jgi:hypothetical protein
MVLWIRVSWSHQRCAVVNNQHYLIGETRLKRSKNIVWKHLQAWVFIIMPGITKFFILLSNFCDVIRGPKPFSWRHWFVSCLCLDISADVIKIRWNHNRLYPIVSWFMENWYLVKWSNVSVLKKFCEPRRQVSWKFSDKHACLPLRMTWRKTSSVKWIIWYWCNVGARHICSPEDVMFPAFSEKDVNGKNDPRA